MVVIVDSLIIAGVVWLVLFVRTGRRSLRELFVLVAYWSLVAAVVTAFCRAVPP
jgi:hypothetical protein